MKLRGFVCPGALALSMVMPAAAQITGFRIESTPGTLSDGTAVVSNALFIDFDGYYENGVSQLLVELDQGSIIHIDNPIDNPFYSGSSEAYEAARLNGYPNYYPPSQPAVDQIPDLAFGTFVAQGALRWPDGIALPGFGLGATQLDDSETTPIFFDAMKISQSYNPVATHGIINMDDFAVAQLTFTADASGSFAYFGSAPAFGGLGPYFYTRAGNTMEGTDLYHVRDGRIVPVPEPVVGWLVLAGFTVAGRAGGIGSPRRRGSS